MANGNGNGIDPRIKDAQRQLLKAQEPLADLDRRIATLQQQLQAAENGLANAEAEHASVSHAYVDDDSPANRKRLLAAAEDAQTCRAKINAIGQRLAPLQAQRQPLDAAVQRASALLSTVSTDVRVEVLDAEIGSIQYKIAQYEQGIFELGKRLSAAKQERLHVTQARAEAEWRANKVRMAADFARANPGHKALQPATTRQGF